MARNSEKAIRGGKKVDDDPYFYGDDYISDSGDEEYLYNDDSEDEDFVMEKVESKEQLAEESDEEIEDNDDEDFLDFDSKSKLLKKKPNSKNNRDKINIKPRDDQDPAISNIPGHFVQLDHNYALVAVSNTSNPEHCYVKTVTRTVNPGKRKRKGPIEVRTEYFNDEEYLGTFEKVQNQEKRILGKSASKKLKTSVFPSLTNVKCTVVGGVDDEKKVIAPRRLRPIEKGSFTEIGKDGRGTRTVILSPASLKSATPPKITILYPGKKDAEEHSSGDKSQKKINIPIVVVKQKSQSKIVDVSGGKGDNSCETIETTPGTSLSDSGDFSDQVMNETSDASCIKHEELESSAVTRTELKVDLDISDDASGECKKIENMASAAQTVTLQQPVTVEKKVFGKKKSSYGEFTKEKKWAIVDETVDLGHSAVCKKYKIPSSTLSTWKKQYNLHLQEVQSIKEQAYDQELDDKILTVILQTWDMTMCVSTESLKDIAKQEFKQADSVFVPDDDWMTKFLERHDDVLTSSAPLSKLLPSDLESKVKTFLETHRKTRIKNRIGDNNMICMDEMSLEFSIGNESKTGNVRYDGTNPHCTVLLSSCSDGSLLPPMVVFKDHKIPDIPLPDKWKVISSKDGKISVSILCQWITDILIPYRKKNKYKYALVWDAFTPHKDPKVKETLQGCSVVPVFIPDGCSSKIQALDMGIKQFLRMTIKEHWVSLLSERKPNLSPRSGTRSSSKLLWSVEDVLKWTDEAFSQIGENDSLIQQSFRVAGIANALDHSEDSLIRNDKELKLTIQRHRKK